MTERWKMVDPDALADRLSRERGIVIRPDLVDAPLVELTPENEGQLVAEYGFDALVRYYCPNDPRLRPLGEINA